MTTESAIIRRALPHDVATMMRLTDAAYRKYVPALGRKPQPMTTDYQRFLALDSVWLLEIGQQAIGTLVLEQEPDALLIYSVAIDPAYQKRGYGRQLLAWAEACAMHAGLRHIRLYTNGLMEENIALYTRLGYHVTHREAYLGGEIVHMGKDLADALADRQADP